jgi:hypothetical protein
MGKSKTLKQIGLCWRCEHRALWFETEGKHQPRCECGSVYQTEKDRPDGLKGKIITGHSSGACYMFKPVKPVTLEAVQTNRPFMPGIPMITSRMSGTMDQDGKDFNLHCDIIGRKKCQMFWLPVRKVIKKK